MSETSNENEWLLSQDLGKARVVSQEDVKLYRHRAILAFFNEGYEIVALIRHVAVPVENDEGKVVGTANVVLVNDKLVAEIVIDYATPERLAAETRDGVRHWPRIVGWVQTRTEEFIDMNAPLPLVMRVKKLVLSTERPSDTRLLPFGEPIL